MFLIIKIRDVIIQNHLEGQTKPLCPLCNEDLKLFQNWKFDDNITDDKANTLTTQGWDDHRNLATHFQLALPNLLENNYSPQKYRFQSTLTDRTIDSMKAFQEGLFGIGAYEDIVLPLPLREDFLLRVCICFMFLKTLFYCWRLISLIVCVQRLLRM